MLVRFTLFMAVPHRMGGDEVMPLQLFPPRLVLLAAVCALTMAAAAEAAPVLEFGPARLTTVSEFNSPAGDVVDVDDGAVPHNDSRIFRTLASPPGFAQFPENLRHPQGFVSTSFSAQRFGGVGISGISAIEGEFGFAGVAYEQSIFNRSGIPATTLIDYTIPSLQAAILGDPSISLNGPEAFAEASLVVSVFDSLGNRLSIDPIFSYSLTVNRELPGGISRSADLLNERGAGLPIILNNPLGAEFLGIQYAEFSGVKLLPDIPQGGRVDILYLLSTSGGTGAAQTGYHALVGDPFDISGARGFEIRLAEPAAVPEPATVLLMPVALAGLLVARRRWS